MNVNMEELFARQCGPALTGIKPSNLVSISKDRFTDIHDEIQRLNLELNKKGILFEVMHEFPDRVLVLVYRPIQLYKYLKSEDIRKFLLSYGYPLNASLSEYIYILKSRLNNDDFPHEIGAFLGYPLDDIYGFIYHKYDGVLFVGEWKVYSNEETARKLFKRFSVCRNMILKRLKRGESLAKIFCAA